MTEIVDYSKMRAKFIKFLIKHGAFATFCQGLKRRMQDDREGELFDDYLSINKVKYDWEIVILGAFTFHLNDKGQNYWRRLHSKWQKEMMK